MKLSLLIVLISLVLLPGHARAYTLASGITPACHEELTTESIFLLLDELEQRRGQVPLPNNDLWERPAEDLFNTVPGLQANLPRSTALRFVAFSFLLGVRHPDTQGHSVSSLVALRRIHADPEPERQHVHCLRATLDDGAAADRDALIAIRTLVRDKLMSAAAALAATQEQQLMPYSLYFEFTGQVDITVYSPAFLLGEALHILQDSFAHTIRSADGSEILTILNFVDAAEGQLDEPRDGIAHSRTLDECGNSALQLLSQRAVQTSLAATRATLALRAGDDQPLEQGLTPCPSATEGSTCGWLAYPQACELALEESGTLAGSCCSSEADFCNSPWLVSARSSPTLSLAQELGCAHTPRPTAHFPSRMLAVLLLLAAAVARRLPSRRRKECRLQRRRQLAGLSLLLTTLLSSSLGRAAPPTSPTNPQANAPSPTEPRQAKARSPLYVSVEAHGSLLSGQPERGLLDVSFGPGLRVGQRPSKRRLSLGYFGSIEQSSVLATETVTRLDAGTLQFALGLELSYFAHLAGSIALGPSILLSDTLAHSAPQVGLYLDLRPVGFRFRLSRHLHATLDPLTATWVAPALSPPMVSTLRYRIVLGLSWHR